MTTHSKIRFDPTCTITQLSSRKDVVAEVHEFSQHDRLIVVVNKSIKVHMKWNGKMYEGAMAGMDFVSAGPVIERYSQGRA